jgi:hypothetical protein
MKPPAFTNHDAVLSENDKDVMIVYGADDQGVWSFNIRKHVWKRIPSNLAERECAAIFTFGRGSIAVAGGAHVTSSVTPTRAFSDVTETFNTTHQLICVNGGGGSDSDSSNDRSSGASGRSPGKKAGDTFSMDQGYQRRLPWRSEHTIRRVHDARGNERIISFGGYESGDNMNRRRAGRTETMYKRDMYEFVEGVGWVEWRVGGSVPYDGAFFWMCNVEGWSRNILIFAWGLEYSVIVILMQSIGLQMSRLVLFLCDTMDCTRQHTCMHPFPQTIISISFGTQCV